jgi:phosphatidate cytidylyltransferase
MPEVATAPRWRLDGALKARILTAVVLTPLAVAGVLWLPSLWFAIALGLILCGAMWEWTRVIGFRMRRLRAAIVAGNAALMLAMLTLDLDHWLVPIVWVGVGWWCVALVWLKAFEFGAEPTRRNLEIKAVVGSVMLVPAWAAAWLLHGDGEHGPVWTLYVLVLIWIADISAYFAGRRFGQHKLAPRISPGKTIEGVYGALAGTLVYAALVGWAVTAIPVGHWQLIVLSLLTVGFSIVGDLFESLIKRQAHIKDSGSLLPGHGGLLDRIDSVLAALPIFVVGRQLIGL